MFNSDLKFRIRELDKVNIIKDDTYKQCISCKNLFPPTHYNKQTNRCLRCDKLERFSYPISLTITNK